MNELRSSTDTGSPNGSADTDGPKSGRIWPFVAAFVLVALAYLWTTRSNNLDWHFGAEQKDYYNLLVHGFLDGHLSLKADVAPELLQVPNPYDPGSRPPGLALHDASLFHGKYYIYYGVVPAAVALLPFRLIAGFDLPVPVAVLGFALAADAVALLIIARLRRRYFPRVGGAMTFLLCVAFAFASCGPFLVRRSSMYELPITCASFFALSALGCFFGALVSPRRRLTWLALASLGWGLAIGSRPTYLLAPAGLLVAHRLFFRDAEGKPVGRTDAVRLWVAAMVPLLVIGLMLAWYNEARFGSPTEFGVSYILSGVYEAKIEHFQLRYVPWNIHAYLFAPAAWGRYFPFFHDLAITWPKPRQHYGMDLPFGLLVNIPFIWLAAGAVLPMWKWGRRSATRELALMVAAMAWAAIAVSGMIFCFYAAMARYLGDFAPLLALLAVIGAMAWIEHEARAGGFRRQRIARGCIGALALGSVFMMGAVSVQAYSRFRTLNPARYAAFARFANAPIHAFEALTGSVNGAMELELAFPAHPPAGGRDELVKSGWGNDVDRVVVLYPDEEHVQFEFDHAGMDPVRGEPVPVNRAVPHEVRIAMGSLYPPLTWRGYDDWRPAEMRAVLRRIGIELDGVTVLDRYQRFHDASPGTIVVGGEPGARFSGRLIQVMRLAVAKPPGGLVAAVSRLTERAAECRSADGTFHLDVRFPAAPPVGRREPIVVSGETGRGDFIAVEYLGGNKLRWSLDHWGAQGSFSDAVAYDPAHDYRIEVHHPVYAADRRPTATGEGDLAITMDGVEVWRKHVVLYPVEIEDVFIGENPIGGSGAAERFTGAIRPVRQNTTQP